MPASAVTVADHTSEPDELALWRDAVEAGMRYWGRLGKLAFDSVAVFLPVVGELRPSVRVSATDVAEEERAVPSILVEAEAGEYGIGVFLVENTTLERLSIPVAVSSFMDGNGRAVQPTVKFRPDVITLDPGDQLVVQVAVAIDERLKPNTRYGAEISVPGLSETRIPIVVRRRPRVPARTRARSKRLNGAKKLQS